MNNIVMPDIILHRTVTGIVDTIEKDYKDANKEEETILYRLTNNVSIGDYNFFEQAKKIFFKDTHGRKRIDIRFGFDSSRADLPSIFINMPKEDRGPEDGLGVDQQDGIIDEINNETRKSMERSFSSQYSLVITSQNRSEVLLLYNIIKALMIPLMNHLEMEGLKNPMLSGRDLSIRDYQGAPKNLYMRALMISFHYTQTIDDIFEERYLQAFKLNGVPFVDNNFQTNNQ